MSVVERPNLRVVQPDERLSVPPPVEIPAPPPAPPASLERSPEAREALDALRQASDRDRILSAGAYIADAALAIRAKVAQAKGSPAAGQKSAEATRAWVGVYEAGQGDDRQLTEAVEKAIEEVDLAGASASKVGLWLDTERAEALREGARRLVAGIVVHRGAEITAPSISPYQVLGMAFGEPQRETASIRGVFLAGFAGGLVGGLIIALFVARR